MNTPLHISRVKSGRDSLRGIPLDTRNGRDSKLSTPLHTRSGRDSKKSTPLHIRIGRKGMDSVLITPLRPKSGRESERSTPLNTRSGIDRHRLCEDGCSQWRSDWDRQARQSGAADKKHRRGGTVSLADSLRRRKRKN